MDRVDIYKDFRISMGLMDIMCGELIGEGCSRIVYDSVLKPGYVVKIEPNPDTHHNILEYYMWTSVMYQPEIAKWLAPIDHMSGDGRVMIQKKVSPITDKNRHLIPEKIPAFLTDMKESNYGFIGKQFVNFDYAFSLEMCGSYGMNNKMRKWKPNN